MYISAPLPPLPLTNAYVIMNGPKGREYCNDGVGPHPFYVNVDLTNGNIANHWIDSLQAAFPGVQVLFGDLG